MIVNVHAGHNPDKKVACGAVGLIKESTEARKVVKGLSKYLKEAGVSVRNCTCDDGTSQSDVLKKIVKKCNLSRAALDVSIHFNSGAYDSKGNKKVTGSEVLVYSNKGFPAKCGKEILSNLSKLGFTNRGVKVKKSLYFLRKTKNPAILIEVCFVDDADDVKLYKRTDVCKAIADGILNSIK